MLTAASNRHAVVRVLWAHMQEQEYQVLSDLPDAVEGLGPEHGLTPTMHHRWDQAKLSNTEVSSDAVAQTLVFWRDAVSPYSLVQFEYLADLGASKVCLL